MPESISQINTSAHLNKRDLFIEIYSFPSHRLFSSDLP
jgi:hypothetical protein